MQEENSAKVDSALEGLQFRIKRAVHLAGGVDAAAEATGASRASIYNYQKLKPEPGVRFLLKLARQAKVRPEWLLLGTPPVADDDDSGDWETHLSNTNTAVPIYDVAVSAGDGVVALEEAPQDFHGFPKDYLASMGQPSNMKMIKVRGESMEPEIQSDSYVMFDLGQCTPADAVFVVRTDDMLQVKRLSLLGGKKAELLSTNPAYRPIPVDLDDPSFQIIGRVTWSGRKM